MLNEWSDREPDPEPRSPCARIADYCIVCTVASGVVIFLIYGLADFVAWVW